MIEESNLLGQLTMPFEFIDAMLITWWNGNLI